MFETISVSGQKGELTQNVAEFVFTNNEAGIELGFNGFSG